jgi:hypothetical protein
VALRGATETLRATVAGLLGHCFQHTRFARELEGRRLLGFARASGERLRLDPRRRRFRASMRRSEHPARLSMAAHCFTFRLPVITLRRRESVAGCEARPRAVMVATTGGVSTGVAPSVRSSWRLSWARTNPDRWKLAFRRRRMLALEVSSGVPDVARCLTRSKRCTMTFSPGNYRRSSAGSSRSETSTLANRVERDGSVVRG